MALEFQQTDDPGFSLCGLDVFCSGLTLLTAAQRKQTGCTVGAAAGSTTFISSIPQGGSIFGAAWFEGLPGPELDYDDSADWTIRLNVTTGNATLFLESVHICRLSTVCDSLETIGSATGLGTQLTTGIYSVNVAGAPGLNWSIGNDRWVAILGIRNTNAFIPVSIRWDNDQIIDVPFKDRVGLPRGGGIPRLGVDGEFETDALTAPLEDENEETGNSSEIGVGGGPVDDEDEGDPTDAPFTPGAPGWMFGQWAAEVRLDPGYWVPPHRRQWSLNRCGNALWGLQAIARDPSDPADDPFEGMTTDWGDQHLGFDRPVTLHRCRAEKAHSFVDAHEEVCKRHFGHLVVGADGFDHLAFCYEPDDQGRFEDRGEAFVHRALSEAHPWPERMLDPENNDEPYLLPGQEAFVSGMKLPRHYVGQFAAETIACGVPE